MSMYLSRLRILQQSRASRLFGDGYDLHKLVWSMLARSPNQDRDFLYRHNESARQPELLVLSASPPQTVPDGWCCETKPYSPQFTPGQLLRFVLRANATVTKHDARGRHQRHDVVMNAKRELIEKGLGRSKRPALSEIVRKAGIEWLQSRSAAWGVDFVERKVVVSQRSSLKVQKGSRTMSISIMDFDGMLTVKNVELFLQVLFGGVGHARGFGCGLFLIAKGC